MSITIKSRDEILKQLETHKITLAQAKILLDHDPIEEEFVKRTAHVTIIIDDGVETTIYDIQKMVDLDFDVEYTEPAFYSLAQIVPSRTKSLTFKGIPLKNEDGSEWTEIRRAK